MCILYLISWLLEVLVICVGHRARLLVIDIGHIKKSPRIAHEDSPAEDHNYALEQPENVEDDADSRNEATPGDENNVPDDLDPKKICWLCHLDGNTVKLKKCEGCLKVEKSSLI